LIRKWPRNTPNNNNHGGVAIVARPAVQLSAVSVDIRPTTFEFVAARVVAGYYACTVITVYHPGPDAITAAFFDELTEVLDRAATLTKPIYVVCDFNIRLERADDSNVVCFTELLAGYGLAVRVPTPTHRAGGVLDIVIETFRHQPSMW